MLAARVDNVRKINKYTKENIKTHQFIIWKTLYNFNNFSLILNLPNVFIQSFSSLLK